MKIQVRSVILFTVFVSKVNYAAEMKPILSKLEITLVQVKGEITEGPVPVRYVAFKAGTPSCGLLSNKNAKELLPVLETEQGSDFPFCVGFLDEASFIFHESRYFVFRFQQRDTRPEPGESAQDPIYHFVVQYDKNKLVSIDRLNSKESAADKKSAQAVASWALKELKGH